MLSVQTNVLVCHDRHTFTVLWLGIGLLCLFLESGPRSVSQDASADPKMRPISLLVVTSQYEHQEGDGGDIDLMLSCSTETS